MQELSNNEASRIILSYLKDNYPKAIKFYEMVHSLHADEKALFNNLLFLEESSLVQLMSSYPTGATYPTIHMVKIRDEGSSLLKDEDRLNTLFPLREDPSPVGLHQMSKVAFSEIIGQIISMIEKGDIMTEKDSEEIVAALCRLSAEPAVAEIKLGEIFKQLIR